MKKETKLIRIPNFCKLHDWSFGFSCENIDADSIKAYGCKNDILKDSVTFRVYTFINNLKKLSIVTFGSEAIKEKYDCIALKYDIVQEATKLTIEAEDYTDISADSKGNYTFYMDKGVEVNI